MLPIRLCASVHDVVDGRADVPDDQTVAEATAELVGVLVEEHVVQALLVVIPEVFFAKDIEELDCNHVVALGLAGAIANGQTLEAFTVAAVLPLADEFNDILRSLAANLEQSADDIVALVALSHGYSPEMRGTRKCCRIAAQGNTTINIAICQYQRKWLKFVLGFANGLADVYYRQCRQGRTA